MKVKVDPNECIGCELCTQISSDIFQMNKDMAVISEAADIENSTELIKEAANSCPTDAIVIIED